MLLVPELMVPTFADLPPAFLQEHGVTALFLDIDNTLVPYDVPRPTEENRAWFEKMKREGYRLFFISNNNEQRVKTYAEDLDIAYLPDAKKPRVRYIRRFAKEHGVDVGHLAVVGDQIFTDVCYAHLLGAVCVVVDPIKAVENRFFRFKRRMEKPFVALYHAKHRAKSDTNE